MPLPARHGRTAPRARPRRRRIRAYTDMWIGDGGGGSLTGARGEARILGRAGCLAADGQAGAMGGIARRSEMDMASVPSGRTGGEGGHAAGSPRGKRYEMLHLGRTIDEVVYHHQGQWVRAVGDCRRSGHSSFDLQQV
ncbi:hypothetical protein ZWY2020_049233 [Hordeum vulgare]|nr:hypothetical protein ZWY2020_049233 [Hordeum vulgare]